MSFDGFYLPGLDPADVRAWRHLECNGWQMRWPVLTPGQIDDVWRRLSEQRNDFLLNTPVAHIIEAIDAAVTQMYTNRASITDVVSAVTGYSPPVVSQTLDHMFADWRADELRVMLRAELGDPAVLDRAMADQTVPGKQVAAFGYPRVLHIFSGNVPGVAVTSLIRSLLVKSATLGKTASGEPVLPVMFARALYTVAPAIANCLAITYWPGGTAELDRAAARSADALVVYGGDEAVAAYADAAQGKPLVVHGPRLSFGLVGEVNETLTRDVAHAVAAYDQQGCVSPHLVYVVGPPQKARRFAQAIGQQLQQLSDELPRGKLHTEEAVAIRNARTAAEFGSDAELFGREQDGFAVIYENDPGFRLSCLNRVLYVKPIAAASDVLALLPDARHLQSAALAGFPENEKAELARSLGLAGVSRITSFARLPWPPMHWHHDGSAPIRELLRWQDIEPD